METWFSKYPSFAYQSLSKCFLKKYCQNKQFWYLIFTCFDQKSSVESEHEFSDGLRDVSEFEDFLHGHRLRDEIEVVVALLRYVVDSVQFASLICLKIFLNLDYFNSEKEF